MSGRIIDLTVTLTNNIPAHKFFPRPVIVSHFGHEEFPQWNLGTPGDQLGGATTFIGIRGHEATQDPEVVRPRPGPPLVCLRWSMDPLVRRARAEERAAGWAA
jgi:hypothetical protein